MRFRPLAFFARITYYNRMSTFISGAYDYKRHNAEVQLVMERFGDNNPVRAPLHVHGSITNYFFNPELNTRGYTFEQFFKDPEIHIRAQLEYQNWVRHNVVCDREMGLPDSWQLSVDFQNSYDASWAGAPMAFFDGQLPDTLPIFAENREKLYDMPKILPVDGGAVGDGMAFADYMAGRCKSFEYMGRPVTPPTRYLGENCDGAFDLAYKLRGAENLIYDMLDEDGYYEDLMDWITDNLIRRMRALRAMRRERPGGAPGFSYADDAIALISHDMYKKYVLPYHRRFFDAFADGQKCGVHFCGACMHHFGELVKELPINAIDTGFPVDHGLLRELTGPDITLYTGPTVMLLKDGAPAQIRAEAKRILESGVTRGGKYVMIAANNMAPQTPVENVMALYEAVKVYGRY